MYWYVYGKISFLHDFGQGYFRLHICLTHNLASLQEAQYFKYWASANTDTF